MSALLATWVWGPLARADEATTKIVAVLGAQSHARLLRCSSLAMFVPSREARRYVAPARECDYCGCRATRRSQQVSAHSLRERKGVPLRTVKPEEQVKRGRVAPAARGVRDEGGGLGSFSPTYTDATEPGRR